MMDHTQHGPSHRHLTNRASGGSGKHITQVTHAPQEHGNHEAMVADYQRRFWISLAFTVPILLLSPMIQEWLHFRLRFPDDSYVLLALATFIYLYGGWPFLTGIVEEMRMRRIGMMTLIAVAITAAYLYSSVVVLGLPGAIFFWELATLLDIMLLGHWLEMRSVMGASRALQELARLLPEEAHLLQPDGSIREVPARELHHGDKILIKPGERVPADGRIFAGRSSLNESLLTGESAPMEKGEGGEVIAGAINGEGALQVTLEKTGDETYLSQVIRLVAEAQSSKSRSQELADRAAFWLVVVALGVGILTLVVWMLLRQNFAFALERSITVMVITCPHALGLAVPLVVAVSTALAARRGLLIRRRAVFELARQVQTVVFDKTGTLTEGRFGVEAVAAFTGGRKDDVLRWAAAVEAHSEHSIAQGIVREAQSRGMHIPPVVDFEALPGRGAQGKVDGQEVRVLSPSALQEQHLSPPADAVTLTGRGQTVVYVVVEDRLFGAVALADVIRPESREAISRLHQHGLTVVMLTGDHPQVAEWVSSELGLDEYFAQVRPAEKANKIKELQQRGLMVAMVGDGINDAPALVQADIGIAIGAGTEVAIESADIVLVKNDPRAVLDLLGLARATWRKMVQNLAWATGYNVVAIPLAAGVLSGAGILLSPAIGAIFMSVSTIIVAVNAQLLRTPA